ncbi:MAG TPA: cytochrome c biogenesis protein CcsA [Candidatus Paceibacterota bacterium]|nr:cytochrome c biogenesis protein CcsA [Candidatus Paceibacterota bacterium]
MSPFAQEALAHWIAVTFYIGGLVAFAYALFFAHPEKFARAKWLVAAGVVPHSVALVLRYIHVGHGPYMMKYEVLSSNSWIAIVMLLIFLWRKPNWSSIALVVLPVVILMMGIGLFTNPEARNLPPTLRSIWLIFHILFNKLAVGAFILSLGAAIVLLRKLNGARGKWLDRLPGVEILEANTVRFVGFGFVFWTTTIGMGAIWANQSWGRYWGWDPIESWSLVTWLAYAILLHARLFFKLNGRATAWATIGCFGLSVLTVLIFPFVFPSMHSAYFQS